MMCELYSRSTNPYTYILRAFRNALHPDTRREQLGNSKIAFGEFSIMHIYFHLPEINSNLLQSHPQR